MTADSGGPALDRGDVKVWIGDARTAWQQFPAASADAIITSPPYYGLRDYGVPGQLGLEATPGEYVEVLADLLTSWGTRVLKPHGSLWLNLGDTYASARRGPDGSSSGLHGATQQRVPGTAHSDMPPKSLLMIPERVALALIGRGWTLRNKVIWAKPNGMPSSVTDRLANKHEYLFHLTRRPKYYYDLDAIRQPQQTLGRRHEGRSNGREGWPTAWSAQTRVLHASGANPGDVWTVATTPYAEAHYAVFPAELVRRPILATVPEQVCAACGKGRERVIEVDTRPNPVWAGQKHDGTVYRSHPSGGVGVDRRACQDVGWSDCGHGAGWQPGLAVDPFIGSGTLAAMCRRLGRRCWGVELDPGNLPRIDRRIGDDSLFTEPAAESVAAPGWAEPTLFGGATLL